MAATPTRIGVPEEDKREKTKRLSRSTGGCMGAVHACHGSRTPIHSRMQKRMHAKQRRRCPLSDGEWKAARTRFIGRFRPRVRAFVKPELHCVKK